jgi:hypothetical protein
MTGSGFVKVYSSILASSVWGESLATRVVWITMLAMADREGFVAASSDGIARSANISLKQSDAALEVLSSPDPRSKSQNDEHEGRRIERIDGGYRILNYLKYREFQTPKQRKTAERQQRFRERHNSDVALRNVEVTPSHAGVTVTNAPEAEAEAEAKGRGRTTKAKTTSVGSGEPKPRKSPSWATEGAEWWGANVGIIAIQPAVVLHGWPKTFAALKLYAEDAKDKGKTARVEWGVAEIVKWIEWADMPATDAEGNLTPRGKAIMGAK